MVGEIVKIPENFIYLIISRFLTLNDRNAVIFLATRKICLPALQRNDRHERKYYATGGHVFT